MTDNFKQLAFLVSAGNIDELRKIHQQEKDLLNTSNIYGSSLLHFAALSSKNCSNRNNREMVDFLIHEVGINVDERDRFGSTALIYSAARQSSEILEALLSNEANTDIQDKSGKTALMQAVCYRRVENAEILIKYGAKVDAVTKRGHNIFHLSIIYGLGYPFINQFDSKYRYLLTQRTASGHDVAALAQKKK